jgi:hypothetical protein
LIENETLNKILCSTIKEKVPILKEINATLPTLGLKGNKDDIPGTSKSLAPLVQ